MDDREKGEAENKEKQRKAKIALGNCNILYIINR